MLALTGRQPAPGQSVAKIIGPVAGKTEPAAGLGSTAYIVQKCVNAIVNAFGGKAGPQDVVAGRPVGYDPRNLIVLVDAYAVLTVKQTEVGDIVPAEKLDQVWSGHWGRRLPSFLHTNW